MSDSLSLYDTLLLAIRKANPDEDPRRQRVFAWAVVGVLMEKTLSLPALALVIVSGAKAASRVRRLRRFLANPRVNVRAYYARLAVTDHRCLPVDRLPRFFLSMLFILSKRTLCPSVSPCLRVLFCLGVALVAGCGDRDLDTGQGSRAVRVGYLPNLTHAVALLGLDEGRFQRALGPGARVEPKEFVAGTEMVTAIAAGELDLAYLGPAPAIKAFTQGVKIRLLAGAASGGSALLARPGVTVRSARDLVGKRVTVPRYGNTQDVLLRGFLVRAGLRDTAHGGQVEMLQADSPDLPLLFEHRQIDVALVPEPWGARLEERRLAVIALTEAQMLGGVTMPSAVLVASTRLIQRRPDWTRAWVATHRALVREINAAPEAMSAQVNQALRRRTGKALKPAVLRRAWRRLAITDQVTDGQLSQFAGMMRAAGYLRVPFAPAAFREANRNQHGVRDGTACHPG